MSSLDKASYDPIFFLHHAFVDYIWNVWQDKAGVNSKSFRSEHGFVGPGFRASANQTDFSMGNMEGASEPDQHVDNFELTHDMEVHGVKTCVKYADRNDIQPEPLEPEPPGPCDDLGIETKIAKCITKVNLLAVETIDSDVCDPSNPLLKENTIKWCDVSCNHNHAGQNYVQQCKDKCIKSVDTFVKKQARKNTKKVSENKVDDCDKSLCFQRSKLFKLASEL